jgi:hypothetical protein
MPSARPDSEMAHFMAQNGAAKSGEGAPLRHIWFPLKGEPIKWRKQMAHPEAGNGAQMAQMAQPEMAQGVAQHD